MFIQFLGTRSLSDVPKVFKHFLFGASLSRKAASFAFVSMLALCNLAAAQSTRLRQIASIPDIPQTAKGAPASIVTDSVVANPGATGAVHVVNSDGSVLSIDGDGRIPAADALAHCSVAAPVEAEAEAGAIDHGAAAVVMHDKIYTDAGHAGVQALNVAAANSCQTAARISGSESIYSGLIATDAVSNKIYAVAAPSDGSLDRLLIMDGATDVVISSVNLDHSAKYSSIVADSAGVSPTRLVFVSEYDRNSGKSNQIWVVDPSSGSTLKIPGYTGRLFIIPGTETNTAELVVAGETTVNVFSIADISFAGPPPSPVSSGTYDLALLGNATRQPPNAVLSSAVLDPTHRTLYGNFSGTIQVDLAAQILLSVDLKTLPQGANSKAAVGTSLGKLGNFDASNMSGTPISYALAVDPRNELVYAIPLSGSPVTSPLNIGANVLQAFRVSDGSVYTAALTTPETSGSTAGPNVPLVPSQISVASDGKVYVAGSNVDAVSGRANHSVAIVEYSADTSPKVTSMTMTIVPLTSIYGQTVTFTATVTAQGAIPTGVVNFITGNRTLATVMLNTAGVAVYKTNSIPVGGATIYAQYPGNADFYPSGIRQVYVAVNPIPTETKLATRTPIAIEGTKVYFTSVVTGSMGAVPTGIVVFYVDGVRGGGIGTLNNAGGATTGNAYLTVGTHAIHVVYSGDSTHASSTSNTVEVTILVKPDFSVTANPDKLTIAQGKAGSSTLTVQSIGTYDTPVSLQCVARPQNSTCKFSKDIVTPTPGGVTTKVIITTNRSPIYSELKSSPSGKPGSPGTLTALAGSGFAGLVLLLGLRGRKRLTHLRSWNSILLGIVLIGTLVSLTSSCGFQNPKTPPGSYAVRIMSIGASNGTEITHTTVIQVSVGQ